MSALEPLRLSRQENIKLQTAKIASKTQDWAELAVAASAPHTVLLGMGLVSGKAGAGLGGWGKRERGLTHRHVRARSHKGIGHGVDELAAHAKVAQLDFTARVHQDVGGLHVCRSQSTTERVNVGEMDG